jgi:hypothetical protein
MKGTRALAVVDRLEGTQAVLLVEPDQRVIDVPRAHLPSDTRAGDWLQLEIVGGVVVAMTQDEVATEAARTRIQDKLARLRRGDHLRE